MRISRGDATDGGRDTDGQTYNKFKSVKNSEIPPKIITTATTRLTIRLRGNDAC